MLFQRTNEVEPGSFSSLLQIKEVPHGASFIWWQGRESNPRPRAYESPALPLSYPAAHPLHERYDV
jgi:hypothetical protein